MQLDNIQTAVEKAHLIWGGKRLIPKEFKQLHITQLLSDTDNMLGYVNYNGMFIVFEREGNLLKAPIVSMPQLEDYTIGKKAFRDKFGISTDQHQFQYHLWRKKLKGLKHLII
jgi:hypothetical protein